MIRLEEENLVFTFGPQWHVIKLDDHPYYRDKLSKIQHTKAVDFLAVFAETDLYLIEVKDFRNYRIENKERLTSGQLALELAQKVRDSLACIIGAYQNPSTAQEWELYARLLCNRETRIKVVLWLENDWPGYSRQRKKSEATIPVKQFKQKLTWLTKRVLVCGNDKATLPDMQVTNLS